MPQWSRSYENCKECGTKDKEHVGHGLCKTCYKRFERISSPHVSKYMKEYRWMNGKRLTPEQVRELEEDYQDNLWL